ncbi:mitochondrial thiamine pyrophosphate transporter [Ascosphaera pollenicola]|nr:mitochondrial thiamine pyrophosphate transporter [Ascosphaera pollenicola]
MSTQDDGRTDGSTSHFHPTKYQTAFAGGMAGLVSRFFIAPLDVIKIRLQLEVHSLSEASTAQHGRAYKGIWATVRTLLKEEGVTAFWKGNISAEMMYVGYGTVQFGTYATLHKYLLEGNKPTPTTTTTAKVKEKGIIGVESFIAGSVSGCAATLSTYPFDLLRTRFAAQGNDKVYLSIFNSIKSIHRDEGLMGFFRGSSAAVAQIVPYMGFFFACYEMLHPSISSFSFFAQNSHHDSDEKPSKPSTLARLSPFSTADALTGTVASVTSKTLVFPLDIVRKRLQIQGPTRTRYVVGEKMPEYAGIFNTIKKIVRHQGFFNLYRGLGITLIKAAPASAVTMWVYEGVLRELGELEGKRREKGKSLV